ncbi:Uncharacterised protein [Shigella sonnei]|nr:Uncharacterised protein [Shigella sonnei]
MQCLLKQLAMCIELWTATLQVVAQAVTLHTQRSGNIDSLSVAQTARQS